MDSHYSFSSKDRAFIEYNGWLVDGSYNSSHHSSSSSSSSSSSVPYDATTTSGNNNSYFPSKIYEDEGTYYLNASGTYFWPSSMLPLVTDRNPLDLFEKVDSSSSSSSGGGSSTSSSSNRRRKELLRRIGAGNCPILEHRGGYDMNR